MSYSQRLGRTVTIEGETYFPGMFLGRQVPNFADKSEFCHNLYLLIRAWYCDCATLPIQTSDSTAQPKEMLADKDMMTQSVFYARDFFNLRRGDHALLCLPLGRQRANLYQQSCSNIGRWLFSNCGMKR